jgi:hypothetical protein
MKRTWRFDDRILQEARDARRRHMAKAKEWGQKEKLVCGDPLHPVGYLGELAAADLLGLERSGDPDDPGFSSGLDLEGIVEVKSSTHRGCGLLIPKKQQDKLWDIPCVAVYVDMLGQACTLRGWRYGREVCQDDYWNPGLPEPAWLCPGSDLRSLEELQEIM